MKVLPLDESLERVFWEQVNRDCLDYYFFILDWKLRRDQAKILLAVDGEKIKGAMLVYRDYIVQLRGSRDAAEILLDKLNLEKVELQAPLDCEDVVCEKFETRVRQVMVMMRLNQGEESIQITEKPVRLGVEDVEAVADLMRRCDPEWWGEINAELLKERWEGVFWLGIRREGRLVSVGNTRFDLDFACNIGVVATDERYRGRGYATSIVSGLVEEIWKRSPVALIHVIEDNTPAVRAYSKVGFKPYKTYLSIRT